VDWYIFMNYKNSMMPVFIVDNTKDTKLNYSYIKGYSDLSRLTIPNMGLNEHGEYVWYFNYYVVMLNQEIAMIDKNSVFLVESDLVKGGVIVESKPINQARSAFSIRTQNFYRVIQSNEKDVPVGNVIIIRPNTHYWFIKDQVRYSYIQKQNIMLNIRRSIEPGPDYCLLDQIHGDGLFRIPYDDRGVDKQGIVKYFTREAFTMQIKGKKIFIVEKKNLYAFDS